MIVTIEKQDFDLDSDAIKINGETFINKKKTEKLMLKFVKKLIDEGKLTITEGNESYFNFSDLENVKLA